MGKQDRTGRSGHDGLDRGRRGALAAISFDGIVERLITTGIVAVAVGSVALAIVKQQSKSLATAVKGLTDAVGRHETQISDLRLGQATAETRSLQTFATRSELLQVITQQTAAWSRSETKIDAGRRDTSDKLDKVHGRITDLATSVAALAGPQEGKS